LLVANQFCGVANNRLGAPTLDIGGSPAHFFSLGLPSTPVFSSYAGFSYLTKLRPYPRTITPTCNFATNVRPFFFLFFMFVLSFVFCLWLCGGVVFVVGRLVAVELLALRKTTPCGLVGG
jgi:hypothetical protein